MGATEIDTTERDRLRLAVVSGDDAHHRYLVWSLLDRGFEIAVWIVEPEAAKRRRTRLSRRWVDWGAATYHHWRRAALGLDRYRRRFFTLPGAMPPVTRVEVAWVNSAAAHEALSAQTPDATIVIGCSILKPSMLALGGHPVINVHGGYLPYYRGNHCIFFALDEGELDKIGVSLHYVDEGIDTGDLIEVVTPPIYTRDRAEHLYCRAEKLAFARLMRWLAALEGDERLPRRPQPSQGRTYRTRDRTPYHDLRHWWRRRIGVIQRR